MTDQFNLPFPVPDRGRLEAFFPGPNAELLGVVGALSREPAPGTLFIHGPAGCGKSHLLQGAVRLARDSGTLAAYVGVGERGVTASLLGQIRADGLLCLDDVGAAVGDRGREEALMGLFERAQHDGGRLIFAAGRPPSALGFTLPDLASRLASRLVYRVAELDDRQRAEALAFGAHRRGFAIDAATVEWLLRRVDRDTGAMFALLERIDVASLSERRRVTIPFLRSMGIG